MEDFPKKLSEKLQKRSSDNALRRLSEPNSLIDFTSNDYLGFSRLDKIRQRTSQLVDNTNLKQKGAGGSRLLSGNHALFSKTEKLIARCHNGDSAIIYTSGYNANLGFFECVPQRGDLILFDAYCHASIREGIRLSKADCLKFEHNNLDDLLLKLDRFKNRNSSHQAEIYVVTETVFSMDGDSPDLKQLGRICKEHQLRLILDEAHALGVVGESGWGLAQDFNLESVCFARIYTYGKALGGHGAAIVGSHHLKEYLINFSKSFIYTTALGPWEVAWIHAGYEHLQESDLKRVNINRNIAIFKKQVLKYGLKSHFVESLSAIQCCLIPNNAQVKDVSEKIQNAGFDVRPILAPTVPQGKERLRFCLHSYNTDESIEKVVQLLATFVL